LNRNGISSTCAAPKTCLIFTPADNRAFDAYTIPNDSGAPQCVNVILDTITQTACNLQVNAYTNTYDPANICTNYLADPGLSSGVPPIPVSMSYVIPSATSMVLVVHTTNPGEIGCLYNLQVVADLCAPCAFVPAPDVTVANDLDQCGAVVNYPAPQTTGNCGTVTCSPPAGSFFPVGTTTVTCSETGGASDEFTVTVNDTQAPTLTCPADIVEDLPPGVTEGVVEWTDPGVSDNCPGVGTPTCVPPSGSTFPGGATTPVVCTALDAFGNTGTCAFDVTLGLVSILEIPTLSKAGLAVLLVAFSAAGFLFLRRRRTTG
jgi:hypothetical protein